MKSAKRLATFIRLQRSLIVDAGAEESNSECYDYVINSIYGKVFITPYGDWVACKFDDPNKGARVRACNAFNGKCNFHDADTDAGSLAFENFLRKVTGREPI